MLNSIVVVVNWIGKYDPSRVDKASIKSDFDQLKSIDVDSKAAKCKESM